MIRTESNNIVEAGETNANVLTSTRKVTLEASNTKHGDANLTLKCIIINQVESENSCCYTKTQDYSGEMNQTWMGTRERLALLRISRARDGHAH